MNINYLCICLDQLKEPIVAKLSSQCEDLYSECLKLFQKDVLRSLWDKEWLPLVIFFIIENI